MTICFRADRWLRFLYKNYLRGAGAMEPHELASRLKSLPGSYTLEPEKPPFGTQVFDEAHQYLIDQVSGGSQLNRLLVYSRLAEWKVDGIQNDFVKAAQDVQERDDLDKYFDFYELNLNYQPLLRSTIWKPSAEKLLQLAAEVRSPGVKTCLVRSTPLLPKDSLKAVSELLVCKDIQFRYFTVNRIAGILEEEERAIDHRYMEQEEFASLVNESADYWMRRFGVIDP